jgi:uncharacterized protein
MIKELVLFVIQQLVSQPESVEVILSEQEDMNLLEIKVSPADRGRVIGKEGHTIKSLRVLVDTISMNGKKVSLELSR